MKKAILLILGIAAVIYCRIQADSYFQKAKQEDPDTEQTSTGSNCWTLVTDDVTATVYNACAQQCNSDFRHTASMYTLNLTDILSNHVIAMERTMMAEYGISYGDVVLIEGTGTWDGIWQVQDTMNKRFAGQHKIDILVPNNIKHGKWKNVKVYVPANKETETAAKDLYNI